LDPKGKGTITLDAVLEWYLEMNDGLERYMEEEDEDD